MNLRNHDTNSQKEAFMDEEKVYQCIGEFTVSFQYLENKLREIGWFILDPERNEWPPKGLRNLTNHDLIEKVYSLFIEALPNCDLDQELEQDFRMSLDSCVGALHSLRRDRNRILHSAFIELKAGGEVQSILRSNPKIGFDEETGDSILDQENLTSDSFNREMKRMADIALFLNQAYLQLIHKYKKSRGQGT
jgi:hypothetical protein